MVDFLDRVYIESLLEKSKDVSPLELDRILDRAERFEGLTHGQTAALLVMDSEEHKQRLFSIANTIKSHIYGDRVVLFAPLYVSDYCVNACSYCGYNCTHQFNRRKLTMAEIQEEVRILEAMGHKRIALEAGEDDENCPIDYIVKALETIYAMKCENGEIRRANVNIAATTVDNYKKLKQAGIGTYILFQETYHEPTYQAYHISGPKADFTYHTTAFDRAMQAGIDDVGGGVLFGLYEPYFEVLALMLHNEYLERTYQVGFHTVSVPRIRKAEGSPVSNYPYAVGDETFKKIVAILRLAIPFTGIIVSTREAERMRKELIRLGVSQLSAGSVPGVLGYSAKRKENLQFNITDDRGAQDIVKWVMDENLIPSFCTACYRSGRTGDRFMGLAKSGQIKNVCLPNALMTLAEYAVDYGDEEFKQKARKTIANHIAGIENETVRALTATNIEKINNGERDLFI